MSVQSQIDRLNAIKQRIRTNLVAQGITVPADTMLDEMATQILSVAGEDGVSATHSWSGTTLTVTSASGTSSANLKGDKGDKGDTGATGGKGADGVSVSSVKQTTTSNADGGSNVVTVTLSNGTTSTFTIKNGSKGSAGTAGKTPVRGTDYWTDADQEAIVQQVIAALGTPVFGRVDGNNNIILTGNLLDGNTYTLKYEDAEGNLTEVGVIDVGGLPYVNQIFTSIDTNRNIYNDGQGWKAGHRLNSSGGETAITGVGVTGFIPVVYGDEVRMKNIAYTPGTYIQGHSICLYNSNFEFVLQINANNAPNYKYVLGTYQTDDAGYLSYFKISDNSLGCAYIRVSSTTMGENAIITVNEEIV